MPRQHKKIPNNAKQKHLINDKVGLLEGEEDESYLHFKISYKYYNSHLCEIEDLPVSSARKCLTKLKQLGQSNHKTLYENNIRPKAVQNSGHYEALFSKLDADIDLLEIDLGSASRLFYFTVGHLLYIVSIKNSHIKC